MKAVFLSILFLCCWCNGFTQLHEIANTKVYLSSDCNYALYLWEENNEVSKLQRGYLFSSKERNEPSFDIFINNDTFFVLKHGVITEDQVQENALAKNLKAYAGYIQLAVAKNVFFNQYSFSEEARDITKKLTYRIDSVGKITDRDSLFNTLDAHCVMNAQFYLKKRKITSEVFLHLTEVDSPATVQIGLQNQLFSTKLYASGNNRNYWLFAWISRSIIFVHEVVGVITAETIFAKTTRTGPFMTSVFFNKEDK